MDKKKFLSALSAFLILALILAGCGGEIPEQTTHIEVSDTLSADPPGVPNETLNLIADGETEFKIVYSRSASSSVKRAAESIVSYFADAGIVIEAGHDGGKLNENVPDDTREILLGSTNRKESDITETLTEGSYLLKTAGRRLVIRASDDELLEIAAARLLADNAGAIERGGLTIEKDFYIFADCKASGREGWLLYGIPSYEGGKLAKSLYDAGYGNVFSANPADSSKMMIVAGTNPSEFDAYLQKLQSAGYGKIFENATEKLRAAAFEWGGLRLYTYYSAEMKQVRIIRDKGNTHSMEDFSYSHTAAAEDTTILYNYGVIMSPTGLQSNNCGQIQVIKLADNSLFIIDGGSSTQFDTAAIDGFLDFCREITGTPENEKVRISCWFLTHNHNDHFSGVLKVFDKHKAHLTIERMAHNLLPHSVDGGGSSNVAKALNFVGSYFPDCRYIKLHTGMKLTIANMTLDVLYTHEDRVLQSTGGSLIKDTNDASTVIRLTLEGVKCIITGDINTSAESTLVGNHTSDELKSDIIQVSHHTWNYLNYLYDYAAAPYALFTQSEGGAQRTLGINARRVTRKIWEYADAENCFYAGTDTTGLLLKDGTVTVHDVREIIWDSPNVVFKDTYGPDDNPRDYANDP